jgi:hypothetical protein
MPKTHPQLNGPSLEAGSGLADRRSEERREASGAVALVLLPPAQCRQVEGVLVDMSSSGFRAQCEAGLLERGMRCLFSHPGRTGIARVIWNRITDGRQESGFLIEKQESPV